MIAQQKGVIFVVQNVRRFTTLYYRKLVDFK